MNLQTFWSSQSVQRFFADCNWVGLPLPEEEIQRSPGLGLPVQVFFQGIPWQIHSNSAPGAIADEREQPLAAAAAIPQPKLAKPPQVNAFEAASQNPLEQSVQTFFERCNWTGLPLPEAELLIDTGLCLSVQTFFQGIPWQRPGPKTGQPMPVPIPQPEGTPESTAAAPTAAAAPQPAAPRPVAHDLSLSVQEFFGAFNWQGIPEMMLIWDRDADSLAQPVQQFFQSMPWQGPAKIGRRPAFTPLSYSAAMNGEIAPPTNLNDIF